MFMKVVVADRVALYADTVLPPYMHYTGVTKYDFYNSDYIYIINLDNPIIPKSFFDTPFKDIPQDILYKYSVKGLVDDLFKD